MSRKNGRKTGRRGVPAFESIEPKLLLSGGVTAYVSAGSLYVVGDAEDNDVKLTCHGEGAIQVSSGTTSETQINGGADPVDFADVTNDVNVFLGAGADRLELTWGQVQGTPVGQGDNVAGNVLISDPIGANLVNIHDVTVPGSITVVTGPSASEIDLSNVAAASLLVANGGTLNAPSGVGLIPGSYVTTLYVDESDISGNVTVFNGLGNDLEVFTDVTVGGSVYIQNGADGAYVLFDGARISGSLTVLKGPGGDVPAPDVFPGGISTLDASGYVGIEDSFIRGDVYLHGSTGTDVYYLNNVTIGPVIGVGTLRTDAAGNLFIDGSAGPMLVNMQSFTVEGNVTLKAEGATDALPDPTMPQGTSLGANYEPDLASAFFLGYQNTNSVGGDQISTENYVGGRTLLWTSQGVDMALLQDTEFAGDVTVLEGDDGAIFAAMGCVFDGSITYVKGIGGDMEPTDGVGGVPLGAPMSLASVFQVGQSEVAGNVFVFNASGNALVEFPNVFIGGSILSVNGPGAVMTWLTGSEVDGNVTIVNAGSTDIVNLGREDVGYATSTCIGSGPYSALGSGSPTAIGGYLVILNGIGNDQVSLDAATVGGMFLLSDGPDGSYTRITDSDIAGPALFLRGDGAGLVRGLGTTTGNEIVVTGSTFGAWVLVVNGGGDDLFDSDTDTTFIGDVGVYNGLGSQYLDLYGSFGGDLAVIAPAADYSDVNVGNGITPATGIAGDLTIWTGSGDDNITLLGAQITGATDVRTGFGSDTIAVDDSVFTGAASIDTGVPSMGALADADIVNIEQVASGDTPTVFVSALNVSTGDGDDTVNIGVRFTAGVGSSDNGAWAVFHADSTVDGGAGDDTLNYLTAGNQFEDGSALTAVNVETVA